MVKKLILMVACMGLSIPMHGLSVFGYSVNMQPFFAGLWSSLVKPVGVAQPYIAPYVAKLGESRLGRIAHAAYGVVFDPEHKNQIEREVGAAKEFVLSAEQRIAKRIDGNIAVLAHSVTAKLAELQTKIDALRKDLAEDATGLSDAKSQLTALNIVQLQRMLDTLKSESEQRLQLSTERNEFLNTLEKGQQRAATTVGFRALMQERRGQLRINGRSAVRKATENSGLINPPVN